MQNQEEFFSAGFAGFCEAHAQYLKTIFQTLPVPIFYKDVRGIYIGCNEAFCEFVGKSLNEIVGKTVYDLAPKEIADIYHVKDGEIFESAGNQHYEWKVVNAAGKLCNVMFHKAPLLDSQGNVVGLVGAVIDITQQKQRELEARDNAAFQAVLAGVRGVFDDKAEAQIWQALLDGFVEHFGFCMAWYGEYSGDKIRPSVSAGNYDKYLDELVLEIGQPDAPDACCAMSQAILTGKVFGYSDLENDEGFRRWRKYALELGYASNMAIPVKVGGRTEGGVMVYSEQKFAFPPQRKERLVSLVIAVCELVSSRRLRRLARLELLAAKNAAEKANRSKSLFLANMSHEIRTPMNGVLGMVQVLLHTELNDDQKECLEMLQSSGEALLTIVDDILDFSRIEAGKLELLSKAFDLRRLVGEIEALFSPSVKEKELELSFDVSRDVAAHIIGDPDRLRQVLVNLIGNSVKFTPAGGSVNVAIKRKEAESEEILLTFRVKDTGIGIADGKQTKIFEAFSQSDSSVGKQYGGTGLGLTISSRLVRLMGGEIDLETKLGQGSEFSFTIPFKVP